MAAEPVPSSSAAEAAEKSSWISAIKITCTATTAAFFGLGVRAAWKQAKPVDPSDLSRTKIMSGVGFASKALGIATLISVSGFTLAILGISSIMDVNTPSEFGAKMKGVFGNKFSIAKPDGKTYNTLDDLFREIEEESRRKKEEAERRKQEAATLIAPVT